MLKPLNRSLSFTQSVDKQGVAAWLLPYAPERYIAMPLLACQEIIESPNILFVPGAASHAYGLISWRNNWLPLIDFNALLQQREHTQKTVHYALIVAYRQADGEMAHGALSLLDFPHVIHVQESDFCALPAKNPRWQTLAISCFQHHQHAVPIIDTARLFA